MRQNTAAASASQPISETALARLGARPTLAVAGKTSEAMGAIDEDTYFKADKAAIFKAVGDLAAIKLPLNRILVAIFVRGEKRGSIIIPDSARDEDVYQGVTGLVIKMGPHCFEANDAVEWADEDKCQVGDWVMFRRGDGVRTRVWGRECILLDSERGVKMVLPRPDLVF